MFQAVKNSIRILGSLLILLCMTSCVKENVPTDEPVSGAVSQLYFVQSTLMDNIRFKLYTTTPNPDTTFNIFTVFLSGTDPAPRDIPIHFEVMDQAVIDRYNSEHFTTYELLPSESYQMQDAVTIKAGQNSTGTLQLHIDVSKLEKRAGYLLPVKFSTADETIPIDTARQVAYFVFTTASQPTGSIIGTIPQLMDPRTTLFDFYDDIMLVDTVGDLWVYPLKDRETIGEPYKVGSGYTNMLDIFHDYVLNAIVFMPAATGFIMNTPTTYEPSVTIGSPAPAFAAALFDYRRWFSGVNGVIYSIVYGDQMWAYTIVNHTSISGYGMVGGGGWTQSLYKQQCFLSQPGYDAILCSYNTDVLYAYLMNKGGLAWFTGSKGAGPFTIGSGFFKYDRLFTIRRRDLVGFERKDGRIARYKEVDIDNFYQAVE